MLKVISVNILYEDSKNAHLSKELKHIINDFYEDYDILTHNIEEEDFAKIIVRHCFEEKKIDKLEIEGD